LNVSFDGQSGLIIVPAEIFGPVGSIIVQLALDTGATGTLINADLLLVIGYDPSLAMEQVKVTTGSAVESVPRYAMSRIEALGQERNDFSILGHTLPPSAGIDGLLGLDFMRGRVLTVDFADEVVSLS